MASGVGLFLEKLWGSAPPALWGRSLFIYKLGVTALPCSTKAREGETRPCLFGESFSSWLQPIPRLPEASATVTPSSCFLQPVPPQNRTGSPAPSRVTALSLRPHPHTPSRLASAAPPVHPSSTDPPTPHSPTLLPPRPPRTPSTKIFLTPPSGPRGCFPSRTLLENCIPNVGCLYAGFWGELPPSPHPEPEPRGQGQAGLTGPDVLGKQVPER